MTDDAAAAESERQDALEGAEASMEREVRRLSRPGRRDTDHEGPESDIGTLRAEIDATDAAIAAAIEHRRALSARIQEVRRTAGGPPREPSREEVVIATYADRLGHGGTEVGRAVLAACLPPDV